MKPLEPCPHCQSVNIERTTCATYFWFSCTDCGTCGPHCLRPKPARRAWNKLPRRDSVPPEMKCDNIQAAIAMLQNASCQLCHTVSPCPHPALAADFLREYEAGYETHSRHHAWLVDALFVLRQIAGVAEAAPAPEPEAAPMRYVSLGRSANATTTNLFVSLENGLPPERGDILCNSNSNEKIYVVDAHGMELKVIRSIGTAPATAMPIGLRLYVRPRQEAPHA